MSGPSNTSAIEIDPLRARLDTSVRVPGSKSLTNRALPVAALAVGRSVLQGIGQGDDVEAMLDALRRLGVEIHLDDERRAAVEGQAGLLPADAVTGAPTTATTPGPAAPATAATAPDPPAATATTPGPPAPVRLDTRQSGTATRFLIALAAGARAPIHFDADPQMRGRPLVDLVEALRQNGTIVDSEGADATLPLTVQPAVGDAPVHFRLPGDASSQFLSALLLSAPLYAGGCTITLTSDLVSAPYVDMTLAVMDAFGVRVERTGEHFTIAPASRYRSSEFVIEPDASAASYFFGAAAILGGRIGVPGLGRHSLQGDLGFVALLGQMGATVDLGLTATTVTGPQTLTGIDADLRHLSDTVPTLAVVAAFAASPTTITGIGFIRHKESDRIANVVRELQRVGVAAEEMDDGLRIDPTRSELHGATIETYDDHRMAMAFALLGLRVPGIRIAGPTCVAKTYPGYWADLRGLRP